MLSSLQLDSRKALLQAILFELGASYRRMDEGELRLAIASDGQRLYLNFGKPVASIGFDKRGVEELVKMLREHAASGSAFRT